MFQIRDMENIKFNHRIIMDMMYLMDKKGISRPGFHNIDPVTGFRAVFFWLKVTPIRYGMFL